MRANRQAPLIRNTHKPLHCDLRRLWRRWCVVLDYLASDLCEGLGAEETAELVTLYRRLVRLGVKFAPGFIEWMRQIERDADFAGWVKDDFCDCGGER